MSEDLVTFLKESLMSAIQSLNDKIDKVDEKLEITQVSVSTINNKIVAYETERRQCRATFENHQKFLANDKIRMDKLEYERLPEIENSLKEIKAVKTSYWKAIGAIVLLSGAVMGVTKYIQESTVKKDQIQYITKEDLRSLIIELKEKK